MAKKVKKSKLVENLENYLRLKEKIKELESEAEALKSAIFADPSKLPAVIFVEFDEFEKEFKLIKNEPRVDLTYPMLVEANVDPEPLLPFAVFSSTKIATMMGKPSVDKIKKTTAFKNAAEGKSATYFYRG